MASKLDFKSFIWVVLGVFIISCSTTEKENDDPTLSQRLRIKDYALRAVVTDLIRPFEKYEQIMGYHNLSRKGDIVGYHSRISISNDSICRIDNSSGSGFSGDRVSIYLDKNLNIIDADYKESYDVIDEGAEEPVVTVENVILTLSKDPFQSVEDIHGRYTLLIKHEYKSIEQGTEPENYFSTYEAKFKVFSKEDVAKGYNVVMKDHIQRMEEEMYRALAKDTAGINY